MTNLDELYQSIEEITAIAKKNDLNFYPMKYEICPPEVIYSFASFGLPNRFSHWSFGKSYRKMLDSYQKGLSHIYELVFNTNPCYAFLADTNSLTQNKLIVAHVLAHSDFFRNNNFFYTTKKNMHHRMQNNAEVIASIEKSVDEKTFENTLNLAICLQEQSHILTFLSKEGTHLADWQRNILDIIRDEFYYFLPQLRTKIMNEGWATFWHSRILREMDLSEKEVIEYAELHANVIQPQPTQLNPYLLGFRIFEEIEKEYGREFLFEVREMEKDETFIEKYLTHDLIKKMAIYEYHVEKKQKVVKEVDPEELKRSLLASFVNDGIPLVFASSNEKNELILTHEFDGRPIQLKELEEILVNVFQLWKKPVEFHTIIDQKPIVFRCSITEGIEPKISREYV